MEKLGRITFVALCGDPPADQMPDRIPDSASVARAVREAFAPFLKPDGDVLVLDGAGIAEPPASGLHLVYAYGHAWLGRGGPETATGSGSNSVIEGAANLLARIVAAGAADRTVLILDCCHAAAFDPFLLPTRTPRLVVYASAADEKAIALTGERASRLSLALADELSRPGESVDLARVVAAAAEHLDRDGVLRGQSVSYRMHGLGVRLSRNREPGERQRQRTVSMIRRALIAAGGAVAVVLVALGSWYWRHALVEVDLGGLRDIAGNIELVASEEEPASNGSRVFAQQAVAGNRARLWVPASNVLLRIHAVYTDGAERALRFHLTLEPGFNPSRKSLSLAVPGGDEIRAHPGMAYVPATTWFHGREREPRTSSRPFWIDLRPPTVSEYLKVAAALLRNGELDRENSFVLTWQQRSAAVDAVGLGQLRGLNKDLGEIFGTIEAGTSPRVGAPGDIVVGLGQLPCPTCPAPMTWFEAELYCRSRHMRLPTDLEWELAVRGVDGRVYPWGNQFDATRANVPGLPDKGEPPPELKPVDAYPGERSPFGLIDTVGNAGDWVVNETGAYERVYMGATYRYNQEDATAFRLLPVTDSDYLVREITARCVAEVIEGPRVQ
ncbi:SUMF1/EgtB/PvdO family nonheme iron enzyme [bacterium]|nr:SUMF1/EgtB/PvdO family nonheme iron enzyme [bacterium]